VNPRFGAIVAIVILFAASGVFALAETAFVKASRIKLRSLAEQGDRRAARVLPLYDHQERTLNSVLLLLLGCQMVSATLLGSVLEPTFGTAGLLFGSLLEITVFFTFAEVAPKTYAVTHPERAAMSVSRLLVFATNFAPLRVLTRGFIGLANIVLPGRGLAEGPFVTEHEILSMADVAADEAEIETEERELIHSIFEFGDTIVREVMVPRPDITAIESDKTPGKKVYDPGNPDADRKGYVTMSNVNPVTEMVDLITATRGYEADTTAIKAVEGMAQHAMDVIR